MSRFVRPETVTVPISNGDWLVLKKRLSAGEERQMFERASTVNPVTGERRLDSLQLGPATIVAYLLDWSLRDDAGLPVIIRGKSAADVQATLDLLESADFLEIKAAVDAHESQMAREREAQKKIPPGTTASSPISASPGAAAGVTNGFETSTSMSIAS
jgi:hypothetical protein